MIIGIPRSFLYYKYFSFWERFFVGLGLDIIVSPQSGKSLCDKGASLSIDESCLPAKYFLGHIDYLLDKCDFIFVPRFESFGKNELACVKLFALPDIVKNTFPQAKTLVCNIDLAKRSEFMSFMSMAKKLNKPLIYAASAYYAAKRHYLLEREREHREMTAQLNSQGLKILVVGHAYNTFDSMIGAPAIEILQKLGVKLIFADRFNEDLTQKLSRNISRSLYWTLNKQLLGAIDLCKGRVDGILLLSAFPCGPDALVNDLVIRKVKSLPIINLVIDELQAYGGLVTRLESFVDILNMKRQLKEVVV